MRSAAVAAVLGACSCLIGRAQGQGWSLTNSADNSAGRTFHNGYQTCTMAAQQGNGNYRLNDWGVWSVAQEHVIATSSVASGGLAMGFGTEACCDYVGIGNRFIGNGEVNSVNGGPLPITMAYTHTDGSALSNVAIQFDMGATTTLL